MSDLQKKETIDATRGLPGAAATWDEMIDAVKGLPTFLPNCNF
jgi:hypothetical protein